MRPARTRISWRPTAKDRGRRRRRGDCDVDEGLVQIELVLVDHRSRSADPAGLEA